MVKKPQKPHQVCWLLLQGRVLHCPNYIYGSSFWETRHTPGLSHINKFPSFLVCVLLLMLHIWIFMRFNPLESQHFYHPFWSQLCSLDHWKATYPIAHKYLLESLKSFKQWSSLDMKKGEFVFHNTAVFCIMYINPECILITFPELNVFELSGDQERLKLTIFSLVIAAFLVWSMARGGLMQLFGQETWIHNFLSNWDECWVET